jgi:hypothetical protein
MGMTLFAGREGWQQFGCPDCGNVRLLPWNPDEAPPWCIHHDGNYSWRAPGHPEFDWTPMVRIEAIEQEGRA